MVVTMSFVEFLKRNKDARKIFGKREIKIIEKQILGINLTQSEKNRLSRDIRKKLGFIREANEFKDNFDLKKGERIKGLIQKAKEEIIKIERENIKKIWLFGSVVENSLNFKSDIDIEKKRGN